MKQILTFFLRVTAAVVILAAGAQPFISGHSARLEIVPPARIAIDYPADGSVFPPEFPPLTFLWRDSDKRVTGWRIDIAFADGSPEIHSISKGERMRIGKIDPECVSATNELPKLTPLQSVARSWTPSALLWERIKKQSVRGAATITIAGLAGTGASPELSRGRVSIWTSEDPVGAPIFYRDVPLMPTQTQTGQIKPLAAEAVRLIRWRLLNIGDSSSRVVLENLPMCANCHSFSGDGKTMGMDLDGLQRNRGLYTLTPVGKEMSIGDENLIQWSSAQGKLKGGVRIGFMSQVSPDGQYVVTTINPVEAVKTQAQSSTALNSAEPRSNYYVANFKDYRFLQVFFPARGVLNWYSRATGILQPLPGAADPFFVQTNAVWSPDGKFLVFARAEAIEPNPEGAPLALHANDPNELQIQYDLCRIPFNEGKGGVPEPIAGASRNGMSNSFPKVSPDGKWIIFVQCRNGLLMRPDSQLYIVPASGGQARRMRCNTSLMNSWHSLSPNGRWMVFSSKSRSPYTQMYLTHLDPEGDDTPAILIENATDANRAVNLPEFVNIPPGGLRRIGGPALEYYRLYNQATYFQKKGRYEESALEWRKVLEIRPDDVMAHNNLGLVLRQAGFQAESIRHFQKAKEIKLRKALESNAGHAPSYNSLGLLLLETGRLDEAVSNFQKAVELQPEFAAAHCNLGQALGRKGYFENALLQLNQALAIDPGYAPAYDQLGVLLNRQGAREEAIRHWQKALELNPEYAEVHGRLGSTLYAGGNTADALQHWRRAIQLQPNNTLVLRQTAWVLATCSTPSLRNGNEAVTLAVRAVQLSGRKNADLLDTLAAAYAEAGRFADAALTARRALALIEKNTPRAEIIRKRISLYEAGKPFRQTLIPSILPSGH